MAQAEAPTTPPARERAGEETGALQGASLFPGQSQEDLHLAERVGRALCATGYGSLREIEVTAHARFVTLRGRVSSYYLKQVAQATAMAVPGVRQVRNDLDVDLPI
jgi:osmotically-inducible protein OsmY